MLSEVEFEKLVEEAIEALPKKIQEKMDNVQIIIEKGSPDGPFLGLYQGVPKTAWGRGFGMILPDKITIFQAPLERAAKTEEELKAMVKNVVWHEVAHHFGFSEEGIKKLESKK